MANVTNNKKPAPLVSIAVPVYNGEGFMDDCLNSILAQTFTDWECVVVNNCSTDRTREIVSGFVEMDDRFKLVDAEDFVGLVENWNRLYPNISSGSTYLKVVQADDIIYPESIEEMVAVMEAHQNVGVCSSYRIDGFHVNCDGLNYFDGPVFSGRELLLRHLKNELDIAGSVTTPLFRKSVLEKLPTFPLIFDEKDYHIDTLLVYELMKLSDVGFVFKVLSLTRIHEGADTVLTAVRFNTFLCAQDYRFWRFKDLFPELKHAYRSHRITYAYFLFKEGLKGHRDCLDWHRKYLVNKFTTMEKIQGILLGNGISWRLRKLFGRSGQKTSGLNLNS